MAHCVSDVPSAMNDVVMVSNSFPFGVPPNRSVNEVITRDLADIETQI
jgi:hypothetical protein